MKLEETNLQTSTLAEIGACSLVASTETGTLPAYLN